ncbi:molybdenum cofactor guanylyltransferase [[Eubacterium] cellulosolvens]
MCGAIILAGGPSLRFGRNKALIRLKDKPLIEYVIEQSRRTTDTIVVIISKNDSIEEFQKIIPGDIEIVIDDGRLKSPLTGLKSGLNKFSEGYVAILACDMPFIKSEVLKLLFEKVIGFDLAIPRWPNGYLEPLHAVYESNKTRECLSKLKISNNTRFSDLISRLKLVNYLDISEIMKIDPSLRGFFNINSKNELKIAENHIQNLLKREPVFKSSTKLRATIE